LRYDHLVPTKGRRPLSRAQCANLREPIFSQRRRTIRVHLNDSFGKALKIHKVRTLSVSIDCPIKLHLVLTPPCLIGEMSRFMGWIGGHAHQFFIHAQSYLHASGLGMSTNNVLQELPEFKNDEHSFVLSCRLRRTRTQLRAGLGCVKRRLAMGITLGWLQAERTRFRKPARLNVGPWRELPNWGSASSYEPLVQRRNSLRVSVVPAQRGCPMGDDRMERIDCPVRLKSESTIAAPECRKRSAFFPQTNPNQRGIAVGTACCQPPPAQNPYLKEYSYGSSVSPRSHRMCACHLS